MSVDAPTSRPSVLRQVIFGFARDFGGAPPRDKVIEGPASTDRLDALAHGLDSRQHPGGVKVKKSITSPGNGSSAHSESAAVVTEVPVQNSPQADPASNGQAASAPTPPPLNTQLLRIKCAVLTMTALSKEGTVDSDPLLRYLTANPAEAELLGAELAKKLQKLGGAHVLASLNLMDSVFMGYVARAMGQLQQSADKEPIWQLPCGMGEGGVIYPFGDVAELLKGKRVFLILITPPDWKLVEQFVRVIEGLPFNTSVAGIGTLVMYQPPPVRMFRESLPIVALLETRGLMEN